MSKKIIYLLSLLMALSLVFASCKKNGAGDVTGGGEAPGEIPDVGPSDKVDASTGLYTKYDDIVTDAAANDGYLQSTPGILKYQASAKPGAVGDFLRNPVVTVLGGNNVLVVYEYRYENPGAANDIGVNGSTVVDIKYILSTDSGKSFAATVAPQNVGDTAGSDPKLAKGAPIVFKLDEKTVAVVASGGAALSRDNKLYGIKSEDSTYRQLESSLWYIVGTLNGNTIQWGTWQQISHDDLKTKITAVNQDKSMNKYSGVTFAQYATHSGKGVVTGTEGNKTLLLPVVIADQGSYQQTGGIREYMGFALVKGTWTSGNNITWTPGNDSKNSIIWSEAANSSYGAGTRYKEARILTATDEQTYNYLVVPKSGGKIATGAAASSTVAQPKELTSGYDGSAGFVQVPKWFGTATYDPAKYTTAEVVGTPKNLLSHVLNLEANLNMYVLNDTLTAVEGKGFAIPGHEKSKSSSMDVLADGTIILVSEGKFVKTDVERSYNINFARFPQSTIANKTGNN